MTIIFDKDYSVVYVKNPNNEPMHIVINRAIKDLKKKIESLEIYLINEGGLIG